MAGTQGWRRQRQLLLLLSVLSCLSRAAAQTCNSFQVSTLAAATELFEESGSNTGEFRAVEVDPINMEYLHVVDVNAASGLGYDLFQINKKSGIPWPRANASLDFLPLVGPRETGVSEDGVLLKNVRLDAPQAVCFSSDGLTLALMNSNGPAVYIAERANLSMSWGEAPIIRFNGQKIPSPVQIDGNRSTALFGQPADCEFTPDGTGILVTDALPDSTLRLVHRPSVDIPWASARVDTLTSTSASAGTAGVAVGENGLYTVFADGFSNELYYMERSNLGDTSWSSAAASKTMIMSGLANDPIDVEISPDGRIIAIAGSLFVRIWTRDNTSIPWTSADKGAANVRDVTFTATQVKSVAFVAYEYCGNSKGNLGVFAASRDALYLIEDVCCECFTGNFSCTDCLSNISCTGVCAPGYTGPHGGPCMACPSNSNSLGGSSSCMCSEGYTGDACMACAAGKYKNITGSTECADCPKGTFSASVAATNISFCVSCPLYTTTNMSGASNVSDCVCSPGYAGQDQSCSECAKGTFKSATGPGVCSECEIGKYSTSVAATSAATCVECPQNTTTLLAASVNSSQCVCLAGFAGANAGLPPCQPCEEGSTFADQPQSTACQPCNTTGCDVGQYRGKCLVDSDAKCTACSNGPLDSVYTGAGIPYDENNCTWTCGEGFEGSSGACTRCAHVCPTGWYRSLCTCEPCTNWKPVGAHYSSAGTPPTMDRCQWECGSNLTLARNDDSCSYSCQAPTISVEGLVSPPFNFTNSSTNGTIANGTNHTSP